MRYDSIVWRALALFAVLGLAAGPVGAALPAPDPQAFDAFIEDLESGKVPLADAAAYQDASRRLKALLPPDDPSRQRLLYGTACWLDFSNDLDAGLKYTEAKLAEVREAGDTRVEIRLLFCQAGFVDGGQTTSRSLNLYSEGIALAEREGDTVQRAWGLSFRGLARSVIGEQALALADLLEAQATFEKAGMEDAAESNLSNIAIAYRRMGLYEQALDYLKKYEDYGRRRNEPAVGFIAALQMGYLFEETRRLPEARAAIAGALAIAEQSREPRDIGVAEMALASVEIGDNQPAKALERLDRARRQLARAEDRSNAGMLALYRGQALARLGRTAEALAALNEAERILRSDDNPRYLAMLLRERADVREAAGTLNGAMADLREHVALSESLALKIRAEQTQFLSIQYDVSRRDLENQRLRAEKQHREAELAAAAKTRRWQTFGVVTFGLLCLVLVVLVVRQIRRSSRLRALALTDPLTGLANRRALDTHAAQALKTLRESNGTLTVLTLDIDFFKRINDTYGHAVGDQVLVRVAHACNRSLRQHDRMARTGGEEFVILLPQTPLRPATEVAQRLCNAVAATPMEDLAPGLAATISVGVAEFLPSDGDFGGTLRRADNALYRAKARGRNRVEVEEPVE